MIDDLTSTNDDQNLKIRALSSNLESTQIQLNECIAKYEQEMQQQKERMQQHQELFTQMLRRRVKQDLLVDSG